MTIDKSFFPAFRATLQKHLDLVAAAHGLKSLRAGNATYDPTAGSFTIKVSGLDEGGLTKEEVLYDIERSISPWLPPRGTSITLRGESYTLAGMKSRNGKILIRDAAGKGFLVLPTAVRAALPKEAA